MNDPRLTAYVLGELRGAELKEFENWLTTSPEAQREVDRIRHISQQLREELGTPPPAPRPSFWRNTWFAAATLILVGGLTWWIFPQSEKPLRQDPRMAIVQLNPPTETRAEQSESIGRRLKLALQTQGLILPNQVSAEVTRKVILDELPSLRRCLEVRSPSDKTPPQVQVQWSVDEQGSISSSTVFDQREGSPIATCFQRSFSGKKFPAHSSGQYQAIFELRFVK
ncbi:MAG: hypothetical protein AB7F86_02235 [Bdellovibrionales bacterium]